MKSKPTVTQLLQERRKKFQAGGQVKKPFKPFSWGEGEGAGAITGKVSSAGALGSSLVDMVDPGDANGVRSDVGAGLSGALSGAAAGAALGPIGAIGGALIGGISSIFGNDEAERRAKEMELRKRKMSEAKALQDSQNILSNYDNMGTGIKSLEKGGTVWAWPGGYAIKPFQVALNKNSFASDAGLSFQQGGEISAGNGALKPIGESDSFEVKGHDPNATDDVLLGDAAVDHNEVVKPGPEGLRIFSDTLKPPGSKLPFSKLAKQLEKQKTKDEKQFPEQNKKIEEKLEHLFQMQQAMNGDSQGESAEEGKVPEGEEPGEGFNQGNMFEAGGRLYPIEVGDHKMPGISFQPKVKGYKTYHDITPAAFGRFAPVGFGSEVMAGSLNRVSAESIYRRNAPHVIKGRYEQGGVIFGLRNIKKAKTPTGGTTFDYTSMSPEKNYKKGGNLLMNFNRPTYETAAEGLFEQPAGYKAELAVEPGHGPGAATFKEGGIHIKPSHKGRFTAYKARTGKTTEEALHSKDPHVRKMAQFAKNAAKWKHQAGGIVPDLSKFRGEWNPAMDSTQQALGKQAGLELGRGTYSGDQIPGNIMNVMGEIRDPVTNKPMRRLKGIDYIDYDLNKLQNLPAAAWANNKTGQAGGLGESLSTEDPFSDYPGRRISKYYWEDVQPATPVENKAKAAAPYVAMSLKPGTSKPVFHKPQGFDYKRNKPAAGSITRRGFQKGGLELDPVDETIHEETPRIVGSTVAIPGTAVGNKFDWGNALTYGATLAPVFANMQAARNLPKVPDVYLNRSVNLKRNNYADQQNMLQQGLRTASLAARQNSVNPNAQQAGIGNAQAQYMNAANQMFGDINRSNNDIQRQEAMINAQISGANNQLLGQRSQAETARQANIMGLLSQGRSDLSNKILGLTQQENMKKLDKQKYNMFMAWLNKQGAGLGDRNPFLDAMEGKKMGGIIKSTGKLRRKAC